MIDLVEICALWEAFCKSDPDLACDRQFSWPCLQSRCPVQPQNPSEIWWAITLEDDCPLQNADIKISILSSIIRCFRDFWLNKHTASCICFIYYYQFKISLPARNHPRARMSTLKMRDTDGPELMPTLPSPGSPSVTLNLPTLPWGPISTHLQQSNSAHTCIRAIRIRAIPCILNLF